MITHPLTDRPGASVAEVQAFFDQWALYRRVRELDYLHHRAAYAAVAAVLDEVPGALSFLDLGAGDAECTLGVLAGREVVRYEAVDVSAVALELAREGAAALPGRKTFVQADFVEHARAMRETFNVVLIGLSLHHLPLAEKRVFLRELRRVVAPGGRLIIYEPILHDGETRDKVLTRWWTVVQATWNDLDAESREKVREHVFGFDHPESPETYAALFAEADFRESRRHFTDEAGLYAVFDARA